MTLQQIAFFKSMIIRQLVENIADPKLRAKICESPEKPAEYYEQASLEFERSLYLELRTRSYDRVKELKEALGRIEAGTYGICHECEDDIDVARLMVRPTALFCIECQEMTERLQRRRLM